MNKRNTKIVKLVGPKFKEVRKEANVSLKELAQKVGVVSPSTLSRWERGEEGLPVEIFEKLLTSMNISYNEIITSEIDVKQLIIKVDRLYQNNDVEGLKALAIKLLDEYYQKDDEYLHSELLIKAAIVANHYTDLTGIDLTNDEFRTELAMQLKNINYWFNKEIVLFADVQLLLDTSTIYKLARSLASEMCDKDLVSLNTSIALLNAVFALLKEKQPGKARVILNAACQLNFSQNDLLTKVRIKFMKALLDYVDTGKEYPIRQFLDSLEDEHLKESWIFATVQIKKIYDL